MNNLLLLLGLGITGYFIYKNGETFEDSETIFKIDDNVYAKNNIQIFKAVNSDDHSVGNMGYTKGQPLFLAEKDEYIGIITDILPFSSIGQGDDVAVILKPPMLDKYWVKTKNLTL